VRGEVTYPDRKAAFRYLEASASLGVRADRLPQFDGPLVCTRHVVVFVCEP
jgi:hypothetical protein